MFNLTGVAGGVGCGLPDNRHLRHKDSALVKLWAAEIALAFLLIPPAVSGLAIQTAKYAKLIKVPGFGLFNNAWPNLQGGAEVLSETARNRVFPLIGVAHSPIGRG